MKYIIIILLFVFCLNASAQQRSYRHYSTQKVQARLLNEDAKTAKEQSKIERHNANFKLVGQIKEVTIPVIFHILHNQPLERISEEQVYAQLEALNRDFTISVIDETVKHPADIAEDFGKHVPDKLGIQFCLADIKQGNQEAINYLSTNIEEWGDDDAIKAKKNEGVDPIQPDKYLNVWVGNLADSVSGYAQMPGAPDKTDGIVIDYHFFGTMGATQEPYHLGKTMTHLVGSYLGLYELWNEMDYCGDDYIADTPIHNAPNLGPSKRYKHVSNCYDNPVEMSMNFMDNSDDAYLYLFTIGQMIRMHASLVKGGARHQLTNSQSRCSEELLVDSNLLRNSEIIETISLNQDRIHLSVFPNPANSQVKLALIGDSENAAILIYNAIGKIMYKEERLILNGEQNLSISINNWSSGVYFIHVSANGTNESYQFSVGL